LHITTTICLALLAGRALIPISTAIFTSFVICCLVVTFVCPAWLVYFQRFKNEIRGPWDYDDRKELDEL
jgi:phosphatidylinositol glycan class C protein